MLAEKLAMNWRDESFSLHFVCEIASLIRKLTVTYLSEKKEEINKMIAAKENTESTFCLHDPLRQLLPDGIGFDFVVDNAKSHSTFASLKSIIRTTRSIGDVRKDKIRSRFDSVCSGSDLPVRRPLHPNASFPPANEPRRRPPMETSSFDRWETSSDSEFSYNFEEIETNARPLITVASNEAPQLPTRRQSADAESLSALIANMSSSWCWQKMHYYFKQKQSNGILGNS